MATITLRTSLAGPTDNGGSCKVLYEVISTSGVPTAIFVVRRYAPEYHGAKPEEHWEHVAYANELTDLPVVPENGVTTLYRKAAVTVQYNSLIAAKTAIESIRSQIQRLLIELSVLAEYTTTNTWIISSIE